MLFPGEPHYALKPFVLSGLSWYLKEQRKAIHYESLPSLRATAPTPPPLSKGSGFVGLSFAREPHSPSATDLHQSHFSFYGQAKQIGCSFPKVERVFNPTPQRD
ncbi:hypothetical protein AVEN_275584-1 [Araneus ventricosus]|uniref:Uncharacterized protein n=1 Tax=Araneus ventricosus TaxID=182803 RepID=A0A4Y2KDS1_ARAVE|nr:hypothetical protein AVEN_275584-1 [Araneus ventricosus]